jgi:hypothetical protein
MPRFTAVCCIILHNHIAIRERPALHPEGDAPLLIAVRVLLSLLLVRRVPVLGEAVGIGTVAAAGDEDHID